MLSPADAPASPAPRGAHRGSAATASRRSRRPSAAWPRHGLDASAVRVEHVVYPRVPGRVAALEIGEQPLGLFEVGLSALMYPYAPPGAPPRPARTSSPCGSAASAGRSAARVARRPGRGGLWAHAPRLPGWRAVKVQPHDRQSRPPRGVAQLLMGRRPIDVDPHAEASLRALDAELGDLALADLRDRVRVTDQRCVTLPALAAQRDLPRVAVLEVAPPATACQNTQLPSISWQPTGIV